MNTRTANTRNLNLNLKSMRKRILSQPEFSFLGNLCMICVYCVIRNYGSRQHYMFSCYNSVNTIFSKGVTQMRKFRAVMRNEKECVIHDDNFISFLTN